MATETATATSTDLVALLGAKIDALKEKQRHLARQWDAAALMDDENAAATIDAEDDVNDLAGDLTDEVDDENSEVTLSIRAIEREIAETKATTAEGLLVKLKLLKEITEALTVQWEDGQQWLEDPTEGIDEESIDSESDAEEDDPYGPPNMRQNIKLADKLAASACADAEVLFGQP